jgi:hypothetical protein
MWDGDDPLDGLDKAAVGRLAGDLMAGKSIGVDRDLPKMPKLRSGTSRKLKPLPSELPSNLRPNDPVTVTISLPAYLVIGCGDLGGVETVARIAIREHLKRHNIKWWYPRFLVRVDLPS